MTKGRRIKVGIAGWLFAAIVIGVSRQLSPSLPPGHHAEGTQSFREGNWIDRSFADLKAIPKLRCASAFVVDNNAHEIIYARNAHQVRPIASITKLLTALVVLESGTDLNATTIVSAEDAFGSSKSRLRPGEEYTVRDLLYAALVASDNRAARALSHAAGIAQARFIALMNDKARELGMDSTHVVEPTGLSNENRSTARDCAILVNTAMRNHLIRHISSCSEQMIYPVNKRRTVRLSNTNRLLNSDFKFVGAKTGFIHEAGWCIGARAVSPDGDDVTAVVLGAPTAKQRFTSLARCLTWAFEVVSSPFTPN